MAEAVVTLRAPLSPEPAFTSAEILPGRGWMTLQLRARLAGRGEVDLIASPPLAGALARFARSPGPFPGNESFAFGGAVLIPFANRIRGRLSSDGQTITTRILDREVTLPANFGGRRPGAERVAMHGLILDSPVGAIERRTAAGGGSRGGRRRGRTRRAGCSRRAISAAGGRRGRRSRSRPSCAPTRSASRSRRGTWGTTRCRSQA